MILLPFFTLIFTLVGISFQEKLFAKISEILVKSTTSYSLSVLNIDRSRECIDILEHLYRFTTVLYATNLTVSVQNHPWSLKYFTPSTKVNIWCNYKVGQEFAVLRTVKIRNKTLSKPGIKIVGLTAPTDQKESSEGQSLMDIYRDFLNDYGTTTERRHFTDSGIRDAGPVLSSEDSTISNAVLESNRNNTEDETGRAISTDYSSNISQTGLDVFPTVQNESENETHISSGGPINQIICTTGPNKKEPICRKNLVFSAPSSVHRDVKFLNTSKPFSTADLSRKGTSGEVSESSFACPAEINMSVSIWTSVYERSDHDNLNPSQIHDQSVPIVSQTVRNVSTSPSNSNAILASTSVSDGNATKGHNERILASSNNRISKLADAPENEPTSDTIYKVDKESKPTQKLNQSLDYNPKLTDSLGNETSKNKNERNTSLEANPTLSYTRLRLTDLSGNEVSKTKNETEKMPEENPKPTDSSENGTTEGKNEINSSPKANPNTNPILNQSLNYNQKPIDSSRNEASKGENERNISLNTTPTLSYTYIRLTDLSGNGASSNRNETEKTPQENLKPSDSENGIIQSKNETNSSTKADPNLNNTNRRLANSSRNGGSENNETEPMPKGQPESSNSSRNVTTKIKNKTNTSPKTNQNLNYTNPRLTDSRNQTSSNKTKPRTQTDDDTSEFDIQFIEKSAMGLNPRFYYILLPDFADDILENHLRMLWKKYKIFRFIVIPKSAPDNVYYFSPYPECDVGGRLKKFKGANLDMLPDVIEKTVWNLHKCKMGVVIYSRVPTAIPVDKNNQFNDTEGSKFIGQDGMFMNTLIERMNFTPVMFTPRGVRMEYGIKKVKGNFTGTFYPILNGNAELCSNGHFVKDYQDKRVDFVKPITLDYVSIMAPKASVIPPVITVLLSFELSVWVMLTLTFFSTVFVYVLYLKYALCGQERTFWSSNGRPVERRLPEHTLWSSDGRISTLKYPESTFKSPADRLALTRHPQRLLLSFSNQFPRPRHSMRAFWSLGGRIRPVTSCEDSGRVAVSSSWSATRRYPPKTLWFSGGRSVEPPSGVDVPVVFFDTFRFFISSPPPKCLIVDSNFERILIASILVFTIVITSSFQGNLVRFLSVPVHYPDIDTLKQLEESSLLIWTSSLSWRDIFYSDPILWGLASKVHRWKSAQDMHDSDGNYAGFQRINVHSYKYFKDVILTGLKNNATRKLHTLAQNLITYYLAYIVIKDSPYRTRIDTLISRMEAAGLVTKWSSDVIKYTLETYRTVEERRAKKKKKVFTVADLSAAFIVLAVGAVISAFALLVEVSIEYYRFRYKFRKVIIPSRGSGTDNQVLELRAKDLESKVPAKAGFEFCP